MKRTGHPLNSPRNPPIRKQSPLALRPTAPTPDEKQALEQGVFLREVDDALREEEFLDTLKRHGKTIGAVVFLGLAGLAGWLIWQDRSKDQLGQHAEQFSVALDRIEAGQLDAGMKELEPLTKVGDGSGAAARLMQAGIALEQGRAADAARGFAAVAADTSAPQPFRDLATLREVAVKFDQLPPQQVVDRLKPFAAPGNPWFGSAGEMTAMAWLRLGRKDLAGPMFAAVAKDEDAPESLRSRARQMAGLLGVDAIDDVAKAAGTDQDSAAPGAQ